MYTLFQETDVRLFPFIGENHGSRNDIPRRRGYITPYIPVVQRVTASQSSLFPCAPTMRSFMLPP